jgi:beta-aspartyl-peptidase (threonine type)
MHNFSIAIHGGAGTIVKQDMTPALEAEYTRALDAALTLGYQLLAADNTAEAAVLAAVSSLEDHPLFNAGRGAVFTKTRGHELDAAIMLGHNLAAGAVAGVQHVANPVQLAAAIMHHSSHVMLSGQGALEFAINQGLAIKPGAYFFTQFRYDQWKAVRDTNTVALDHNLQGIESLLAKKKFGTVGAVACDAQGNLAAATSTGGMTNKQFNRIGDSPIIGAGTYANNQTCAISCTGHGEIFIQAVAAYDVSCLMEYKGLSLQAAMEQVVHHKLVAMGGEGGMIGADAQANISMQFNSAGMYRAMQHSNGQKTLAIYKEQL